MKNIRLYIAGAIMLLIPSIANAQALPFTISDTNPVTIAKGGSNLTETGSIAYSAFSNSAAIPFSASKFDVSASYMMWQPNSINSNVISIGAAYNMKDKLGISAALYYGINPAYDIVDQNGASKGSFRPSDMHLALGVSYRFLEMLSVGINVGYASSSLAQGQSYGTLTADAFVMAKLSDFKITAGVSNVLGTVKSAGGEEFCIPGSVALGAGYGRTFAEKHGIDVNIDANYFFSGWLAAGAGIGYTFNDLVSLRAGYRYGGESPIPSYISVGAGVKFIGIKLDVAYLIADAKSPMQNTLCIGAGFTF